MPVHSRLFAAWLGSTIFELLNHIWTADICICTHTYQMAWFLRPPSASPFRNRRMSARRNLIDFPRRKGWGSWPRFTIFWICRWLTCMRSATSLVVSNGSRLSCWSATSPLFVVIEHSFLVNCCWTSFDHLNTQVHDLPLLKKCAGREACTRRPPIPAILKLPANLSWDRPHSAPLSTHPDLHPVVQGP